jgi:hypothetical protein
VVICLPSVRGCTVIPVAPAATQTSTASTTEGTRPPREFRIVAILLTLTDSLTTSHPGSRAGISTGDGLNPDVSGQHSTCALIASTISCPHR